ncbi:MAG: PEP/pyruvate-binding domain-containing protein, partial [Desulfobulbales bacterium]
MDLLQKRLKRFWTEIRTRLLGGSQPGIEPALVFERFRKILNSNNQSLEIIADLGEKLSGDYIFDSRYIETGVDRLRRSVKSSIGGLNELCENRFTDLYTVYDRLTEELQRVVAGREDRNGPQVLALEEIHFLDWERVGSKGARLAEMHQDSSLDVPDGFVITTRTYHDLIDYNSLRALLETVENLLADGVADSKRHENTLRKLEKAIVQAEPPPGLHDVLGTALEAIAARAETPFTLAVRSSAREEDMEFSFAGQFRSILNVKATVADIFQAYLKVVASLFSRKAITYYQQVFPNEKHMSMGVVCQVMVDSRASGVAFSVDTMAPEKETMVIVGAWGQGDAIVEGHTPTDTFIVSKEESPAILERTVVSKPQGRYRAEKEGLETRKIDPSQRDQPCLTDEELLLLSRQIRHLELFYKRPQDIEWSIDKGGRLYILQARPLLISQAAFQNRDLPAALADYECIVKGEGRVAQQGIGAGPVWIVNGPADLVDFPDGAVLVSHRDSSHFVKVMKRAAAIVTETGTPVSHMSTLCREMRVPCLVNVAEIMSKVTQGEEITVDAEDRMIYRGRVKELLAYSSALPMEINATHEFRLLRRILKKVSILNLVDPLLQNFNVEGCRTYHDILRFVHETAVMELVSIGRDEGKLLHGHLARRMDLPIPAGIMVIDIGNGVKTGAPDEGVKFTDIVSIPFRAILQGMLFPGVWHLGGMKVGMRDLMSSMLSAPTDTLDGRYSGHNIAIISREYVNLCFRLGYHFNIIDAHCSTNERDNHIYFRFLGGATDITKRTRRAVMIASILEAFDFNVRLKGDMVVARSGNMMLQEMERTLDILGRLVGFTRQLDVRLDSDRVVEQYVEA